MCVTPENYTEHGGGAVLRRLHPGTYVVRVRARSVFGYGQWSAPVVISIAGPWTTSWWLWLIVCSAFVLSIVIIIVAIYYWRTYRRKVQFYQEVVGTCDFYIPIYDMYKPDAWDLDRYPNKFENNCCFFLNFTIRIF